MIPSIARQSVIIKCNSRKSVLLGNYEFYYAGGLMNLLFGLKANADMGPGELHEYLCARMPNIQTKDEREAYLIQMMARYDPPGDYDGQMRELFAWGETENDIWEINTKRYSLQFTPQCH